MIAANFTYHCPESLEEALALAAAHTEDGKLLAGGHSLVPLMKFRLAQPAHVVDLRRVAELRGVRVEGGRLIIGAMTTHHELEVSPLLAAHLPLLAQTAAAIGDVQVRNKGTIGGSAVHADPAGDWPAALLAADAEFVAAGPGGERVLEAQDFFVEALTSALGPADILTQIRLPLPVAGTRSAYVKFAQKASGFAICGVAALLTSNGRQVTRARIAITGVASKAYRATAVEAALTDGASAETAAAHAAAGIEALSDLHASAEFRRHLATVYTRRAILAASVTQPK